jgi:hypothetical protein
MCKDYAKVAEEMKRIMLALQPQDTAAKPYEQN